MRKKQINKLVLVAVSAALLAVFCPFTIPIGIIPITLSLYFVLVIGGVLGPITGTTAVFVYLSIGILGLPVFSGFHGGIGTFIGPTGGFLIGYLPCVFLAGLGKRFSRFRLLFLFAGALSLTVCGTVGFSISANVSFCSALKVSVLPFLLPDCVKIIGAYFTIKPVLKATERTRKE